MDNITTKPYNGSLVVENENGKKEWHLESKSIIIGRLNSCDISINSEYISRKHAELKLQGNRHEISDLGSRNGLLHNGQKITNKVLNHNDTVRIGDSGSGNYTNLIYKNLNLESKSQEVHQSKRFELSGKQKVTLGRSNCDVNLLSPQVSRTHAILQFNKQQYTLYDPYSTNGTFVNGKRVRNRLLRRGDVIQIASFRITFLDSHIEYFDQKGSFKLDVIGLGQKFGKKKILDDISLSINPCEFVSLVGGSGAGKSTLLKALCGFVRASEGQILINGDDLYANFQAYRKEIGYVPQDDILHYGLNVKRALYHAARLRLPSDTSNKEISKIIDDALSQVDMHDHRDTKISTLSGGQRKRVSIALELMAEPSLFFLDEPTSGLDPNLEKQMMLTLRNIADTGKIVVLVTHATSNIETCDHVVFMSEGYRTYYGSPKVATQFFSAKDFAHIYAKITGTGAEKNRIIRKDLNDEYNSWQITSKSKKQTPSLGKLWSMKYTSSQHHSSLVDSRLKLTQRDFDLRPSSKIQKPKVSFREYFATYLSQFRILSERYAEIIVRDYRNLLTLLLQAPIIALFIGLVAESDVFNGVLGQGLIQRGEAKKLLFMFATVSVWFGIINSAREITKEISIFRRERLVNLQISPYITSKMFILGIVSFLQTALFLLVIQMFIDFPSSSTLLSAKIEVFISLFLTSLAGVALGLVVSAFANTPDRAISIVPLMLIPQILFAGLIFETSGITEFISWLTISSWSMDALGTTVNLNDLCDVPNQMCRSQFEIESEFNFTKLNLIIKWAVLGIYIVLCMAITQLLLLNGERQTSIFKTVKQFLHSRLAKQ